MSFTKDFVPLTMFSVMKAPAIFSKAAKWIARILPLLATLGLPVGAAWGLVVALWRRSSEAVPVSPRLLLLAGGCIFSALWILSWFLLHSRRVAAQLHAKIAADATTDKFVEHLGALFKRKPDGEYHLAVYCPKCRSSTFSGAGGTNVFACACGWKANFGFRNLERVMQDLPKA